MITQDLERIVANQAVLLGGLDLTVKLSAQMHSMIQRNGSSEWVRSGKSYTAISLGNFWIMSLPVKEGGKTKWFKLSVKEDGSSLGQYFLGTKDAPGPARQFARTKETGNIDFEMSGEKWKMTDIGTFDIEATGKSELIQNGDRQYYIISVQNEDRILLYLDARPGESKGIGGCFVGEAFNPETEIESTL